MAEMLYRLRTGKTSLDTAEWAPGLGTGYEPHILEFAVGVWLSEDLDPPYVFTPHAVNFGHLTSYSSAIHGYAFSHVIPEEHCLETGLWEHCSPLKHDWTIGLYRLNANPSVLVRELRQNLPDDEQERYFGGKLGNCFLEIFHGDGVEYCVIDLGSVKNPTLLVVHESKYSEHPLASHPDTTNAMFARLRKSMSFSE